MKRRLNTCSPRGFTLIELLLVAMIWAGWAQATLLWDGNATNGTRVFKVLDLEDENDNFQGNPSPNGSFIAVTNDPIFGKVWLFYKAVNDLRSEAHGASGINPAIGQTYYIGWRSKLILPPGADLNAIFQWKAYGTPQLQDFPITIAPGSGNLNLNEFNPSGAGGQTFLWSTPLITNVWNQHVLCISVSDQDYGGSIQYWFNAVQQTFLTGSNIFYCRTFDGTSVDPKWGVYGDDTQPVLDYVTGLKIGTTYDDVVDSLFALTASPPFQYTGLNGTNITYIINLTTNAGFTGAIQLSVSGLPANTAYSLSPTNFSGQGTATLSVTTSNTTPQGLYTLVFTAIDDGQTNYCTVAMDVAKPPLTYVWNGPGAGSNNWSAEANWSPAGPPTPIDSVVFFDTGAVSGVSNVDNYVDRAFGGTITSLQYGNTNNNHTTSIAAGMRLNVGSLTVGTETDNGAAQTMSTTITGASGTLELDTSSDLVVRQGSANSGSHNATLQMAGLGNFDATLGRVLVGVAGPVARATGTLYLATTNTIFAGGAFPQICVGDNHGNGGGQNYLYLGQTNSLFINSMTVGRQKAVATLAFNSGFSNPGVLFRNLDQVSPVQSWSIGDNSAQSSSSSSSSGNCDFSLGRVDAMVTTLSVGVGQTSTGANSSGTLTFSNGVINVNTLQIGVQSASGATSAGVGHVNVNGSALLVVNSALTLGMTSGGAGTTNTYGALSINGGTVLANAITAGVGSGSNSIVVSKGAVTVTNAIGSSNAAITTVSLTNATLQFFVANGQPNLVASNLITGGASNILDIAALPAIGNVPAQFQLIEYAGSIGGGGYNFKLGFLPPAGNYRAYLSNNFAAGSVDLMAVQLPTNGPQFSAAKIIGTNVVFSGSNGPATWPYFLLASTNLALPLSQWQRLATNVFDGSGNFVFTNSVLGGPARRFFRLQVL